MSDKFIPLSVPRIKGNEWKYLKECLDTGWVSSAGRFVEEFEKKVCLTTGVRHAVSCVNGTSALHTALLISKIGLNDEVIVPAVTFIAPVNAVRYAGAEPVFMDCDEYLNIDTEKLREFIEQRCYFKNNTLFNKDTRRKIRAIIPVHIFGHPVRIEPLMDLAKEYKLLVIEDASESLGSYYRGGKFDSRRTGSIGDIGCLSFNGNKIITSGGGGMLITNNARLAERARYLTTQARNDVIRNIHNDVGYNYRLTNIQAALGMAQVECLDDFIAIKRRNFQIYENKLAGINGITLIKEPAYGFSNYWFYSILVERKDFGMSNFKLLELFEKYKVQTRPLWYLNHRQKPYVKCQAYKVVNAEKYYQKVLNLPCSTGLTIKEIDWVTGIIKENAKT